MSDTAPPPAPARTYSVRRGHAASEIAHIQALWAGAFASLQHEAAAAKINAQYLHNPAGDGECFFLDVSDETDPVGVQCLVMRRFRKDGVDLKAGTMADYVVDSRHRSLGPALQLMKTCITHGNATLDFLFGFPNKKAEPIFKRVGLSALAKLTRHAKLMRSREFLKNRLTQTRAAPLLPVLVPIANLALMALDAWQAFSLGRDWRWQNVDSFGAEFDTLWQRTSLPGVVVGDRSRAMLHWRYPQRNRHHIAAGYLADGQLGGYVVWSVKEGLLVLHDFYCHDADNKLTGMLTSFAWHHRHTGANSISLEFNGPAALRSALHAAGFRPRDENPVFMLPGQASTLANLGGDHLYLTSYDRDSD